MWTFISSIWQAEELSVKNTTTQTQIRPRFNCTYVHTSGGTYAFVKTLEMIEIPRFAVALLLHGKSVTTRQVVVPLSRALWLASLSQFRELINRILKTGREQT
jgi:hypothetical protein